MIKKINDVQTWIQSQPRCCLEQNYISSSKSKFLKSDLEMIKIREFSLIVVNNNPYYKAMIYLQFWTSLWPPLYKLYRV